MTKHINKKKILILSYDLSSIEDYRTKALYESLKFSSPDYDIELINVLSIKGEHANNKVRLKNLIYMNIIKFAKFIRNKTPGWLWQHIQQICSKPFHFFTKNNSHVIDVIKNIKPDIIISSDKYTDALIYKKNINNNVCLIADLHEIYYYIGNVKQKLILSQLKKILLNYDLLITVSDSCTDIYKKDMPELVNKKFITIPNVPRIEELKKIEKAFSPELVNENEVNFLIHGGYRLPTDAKVLKLVKLWHKVVENFKKNQDKYLKPVLNLRLVPLAQYEYNKLKLYIENNEDLHEYVKLLSHTDSSIAEQIKQTINKFDIGIIAMHKKYLFQAEYAIPNRLGVYAASGLAMLLCQTNVNDKIINEVSKGLIYDPYDTGDTINKILYFIDNNNQNLLKTMKKNSYNYFLNGFNHNIYFNNLITYINEKY